MIKFKGSSKGRTVVGFGISRENWNRMLAGDPIHIHGEEIGLPKIEFLIVGGETEQSIYDDMKRGGVEIGKIIKEGNGNIRGFS